MDKLKPCPFCGRDIKRFVASYIGHTCTQLEIKCCVEFSIDTENIFYSDKGTINFSNDAIELWNTRADCDTARSSIKGENNE